MSFEDDKNGYWLREGKTYVINKKVYVGPELLTLSLDDAYSIVHLLENSGEVRERWKKANHQRLRERQIKKRIAAFVRAGASKQEAEKKAKMIILRQEEREQAAEDGNDYGVADMDEGSKEGSD